MKTYVHLRYLAEIFLEQGFLTFLCRGPLWESRETIEPLLRKVYLNA